MNQIIQAFLATLVKKTSLQLPEYVLYFKDNKCLLQYDEHNEILYIENDLLIVEFLALTVIPTKELIELELKCFINFRVLVIQNQDMFQLVEELISSEEFLKSFKKAS